MNKTFNIVITLSIDTADLPPEFNAMEVCDSSDRVIAELSKILDSYGVSYEIDLESIVDND